MKQLYEQHPLPWVVDDNREGREGLITVYDANGGMVICTGDLEYCTWADILLARLITAAPDLLAALLGIEAHHIEQNRMKGRDERSSRTLRLARAAIAKARGEQ